MFKDVFPRILNFINKLNKGRGGEGGGEGKKEEAKEEGEKEIVAQIEECLILIVSNYNINDKIK